MPRRCTTHHYACACREAKFAALEKECAELLAYVQALEEEAGGYVLRRAQHARPSLPVATPERGNATGRG